MLNTKQIRINFNLNKEWFYPGFYKTGNNILKVGYVDSCENWLVYSNYGISAIKKIQTYKVNKCDLALHIHNWAFV